MGQVYSKQSERECEMRSKRDGRQHHTPQPAYRGREAEMYEGRKMLQMSKHGTSIKGVSD